MLVGKFFGAGLILLMSGRGWAHSVLIEKDLVIFLETLAEYRHEKNDIIFVLDESGSIGKPVFRNVVAFSKLLAQKFTVAKDESRVTVLTYSTNYSIPINFIGNPYGLNMCILLEKIDKIGYAGWSTQTDKAMSAARDILIEQGRRNSNKIMVLLTDGESDERSSTIRVSETLKKNGIIIFAVGVAGVNMIEINAVATSSRHIYVLKEFHRIDETMNLYLHADTIDTSMGLVENRFCNSFCIGNRNCCDSNAECACGLSTGRYECVCSPGYQGIGGYKGECHKCPKGAYKSDHRNWYCTACPLHSTTEREGCTDIEECVCESGYEKFGYDCLPIRCPPLALPAGGFLVPAQCNNTYGSQCFFDCTEGYCPISCRRDDKSNQQLLLTGRTCMETRMWSGEEFSCERITCPDLPFPENGMHNCSVHDFAFGSRCSFQCVKGYQLFGSMTRTCLSFWTGEDVECKKISCEPLKTVTSSMLRVTPTECATTPMPYGTTCLYYCPNGYKLVRDGTISSGTLSCDADKMWSGGFSDLTCIDTEPPQMKCPTSITVDAELHKGYARVEWKAPVATDNSPGSAPRIKILISVTMKKATDFNKETHSFYIAIGETEVFYEAVDQSGLSSFCSFKIIVLDKEPPKCVYCPADIEIYHNSNETIPVTWNEPEFKDNSKKLKSVVSTHEPGYMFSWGPTVTVHYSAEDEAGNSANCSFEVTVKPYACPFYPPPANGLLTCADWMGVRLCKVFCQDGYGFADRARFGDTCICQQERKRDGTYGGKWVSSTDGSDLKMPWPDCAKKQTPVYLNTTVTIEYDVEWCSENSLKKFEELFLASEIFKLDFFCPKGKGECPPENVKIDCNNISTDAVHGRARSDIPILIIDFDVTVFPNSTDDLVRDSLKEQENEDDIDWPDSPIFDDLENEILANVQIVYNGSNVSKSEAHYNVTIVCVAGQTIVDNLCVDCPAGTYKDDINETCTFCSRGTYQDQERQFSCKQCPKGYTTHDVKSKSVADCKGPCQPGFFSDTGYEPCLACSLNSYQNIYAAKECEMCPRGLYTVRNGADSLTDCAAPCKQGTHSVSGLEPCSPCEIGSYQNWRGQTNCTICPDRTSTATAGATRSSECKDFDICAERQPCKNGATCTQKDKNYECLCPNGLTGTDCEVDLNDCASDPCLNNGTCLDGIGNFTCVCLEGWTGLQCQTDKDDCDPNPCFNGALCIDKMNARECVCLPGFAGDRCQWNVNECESNPCLNGGICFDMENGYRCCCSEGFTGSNCENELKRNACDDIICKNGGTCSGDRSTFNCTCSLGFEGEFCESNIDDCLSHLCENGGVCVDGIGQATCNCLQKYTGSYCETALFADYMLTFPSLSTSNYVQLSNSRHLHAITVAFFMKTGYSDPANHPTPVSYGYNHGGQLVDNALTFYNSNKFIIYIQGTAIYTRVSANGDPLWHHYAVTWEKKGGKWSFYVDGRIISSGQNVGENAYMHPGTFVLGQEQDDVGSGFSVFNAFTGDITEFNVWDYSMTSEEIKKISSACGFMGNVIPWYLVRLNVSGDVQLSRNIELCRRLGECQRDTCDCFYSTDVETHSCKNKVSQCLQHACADGHNCISSRLGSFCSCEAGFEGRRCEYDINECLEDNGGCDNMCVNEVGSYHCECPTGMLLAEDGKTCHDKDQLGYFCSQDGETYLNQTKWLKNCQVCICENGIVKCEDICDNETSCSTDETFIKFPGHCCPKCVKLNYCVIHNDTIQPFDATSQHDIRGIWKYTAVQDCIEGRFKLLMEFPRNGRQLVLYQDCLKLTVRSDATVYVGDTVAEPPLHDELWTVDIENGSVTIRTNSELSVSWDFANDALIALPDSHVDKMSALCRPGDNFDWEKPRTGDDLWVVGKFIENDVLLFIYSN